MRKTPRFWESLRIPYNAIILLLIGYFDPGSPDGFHRNGYTVAFFGLLPANVAYCLGPLVECYFLAFGPSPSRRTLYFLRMLLLLGGLILSTLFVRLGDYVILYGI